MNDPRLPPPAGVRAATCPRCGAAFTCGARSDAPCPCSEPVLPAALRAELSARYVGCLCVPCLRELQAAATTVATAR